MSELSELYGRDYTAWAHRTAELIRAREFSQLDIDHLLEELESMGASEQRELVNRLRVLLAHLLKWQFQHRQLSGQWAGFDGRSWEKTIVEQRDSIQVLFEEHPGMKRFFTESIERGYQQARRFAAKESKLPITTFPAQCPYSQAQILDDDYYPPME